MFIKEFLNSTEVNGYHLTVEGLSEDFVYSEEFKNLLEKKGNFSFKVSNKINEITENDLLMEVITLLLTNNKEVFVEIPYSDNNDDTLIMDYYRYANLMGISISVYPVENINENDYLNILKQLNLKILKNENKIYLYPSINFLSYVQNKMIIEKYAKVETEEDSVKVNEMLSPSPNEYFKSVFFQYKDENWFQSLKDKYFDNLSEEKEIISNNIENILSSLKSTLLKNKDYYSVISLNK